MLAESKQCQNCKKEFRIEPEDFAMYEKRSIPPSDKCPVCRWKHLLSFWVFGRFRIGESALSGKRIITVLPENTAFPVYDYKEFISDKWDPMVYGQNYDFDRPFFKQFAELQAKVPHPHQVGLGNTDCPWTDDWWYSKECYLCRSGIYCEKTSYAYRVSGLKDCVDITYSFDLEQSYDCLYCFKSYKLRHAFNSRNCLESAFLYDCRNVQNCFMCWNLRNKKYHILNKPYSKDDYFKKLKEFDLHSYSVVQKFKEEFASHIANDATHRENFNTQTVNCRGNFLSECKNCYNCYFVNNSENLRHSFRAYEAKDAIDTISCMSEHSAVSSLDQLGYGNVGLLYGTKCRYSVYLDSCDECEYCFGCIGLRKKSFCILNKQYSEQEYHKIVEKIKADMQKRDEWGRFLPLSMAYSGYNLSLAQIMFPEKEDTIAEIGGRWDTLPVQNFANTINSEDLPGRIDDVKDDIVKQRIICAETGLSYNIAPHELAFYKEHGIPLPRRHFDLRTLNRFRSMTLMIYPQRGTCMICQTEIEHYYSSKLGYKKIACVDCYQREVV
ncbi:MAG: hypothetical protein UX07_C0004G0015 [Parcubacteria group bacterium GW2011_GWA2_45_30]|nr:MAG: hypothetical protein UX07_C0004G0015 [Parcubacteria group bacterium GW2011_GWA2_45_30]